ncbi:hypothetical protein J6590_099472, partial [Homalodisca vitripennis]
MEYQCSGELLTACGIAFQSTNHARVDWLNLLPPSHSLSPLLSSWLSVREDYHS